MDSSAKGLLEKLLKDADKVDAGVRSRAAALSESNLASYRALRSLHAKESIEATMMAGRAHGAIRLIWDNFQETTGFIKRIELIDKRMLASFLGKVPLSDILDSIRLQWAPYLERFPVLNDVMGRWAQLKSVRSLDPDSVLDWIDAIKVIDSVKSMAPEDDLEPIREASYRIFRDSKRIEKLTVPADVLLTGSIESAPRDQASVWGELGLFREEHPVLLAGNVIIRRERVTSNLDSPYTGLPAATVLGLSGPLTQVMTIENLTTFHSEARRRKNESILILYTAGMPSPAWRAMYRRLLADIPASTPIYHWGDVDEGGFRIASVIARDVMEVGHVLKPWRMHPDDIPVAIRQKTTPYILGRIQYFAELAGWGDLGDAVAEAGFTVEQEGFNSRLT